MIAEELRFPMAWGHVAAKAWGSPSSERVLLVHGLLDNAGSFDRLISLLPEKYYFICIDLPGHGLSSHFPTELPLDYMDYVLTIRKVLDCLKWHTCLYIGHSLGAAIGLTFSSLYPDRVKRILCLDAIVAPPISNHELVFRIRQIHDNALRFGGGNDDSNLYSEDEIMYMLVNSRYNSLNFPAAKALMRRSVTKAGDKYKFNRDKRLTIGVRPLLNLEQHCAILKHLAVPLTLVLAEATISATHNEHWTKLGAEFEFLRKHRLLIVKGNHDVHNNHPERVAPHICQFLTSFKSNL